MKTLTLLATVAATFCAGLSTSVLAQIPIDLSSATLTKTTATGFQVDNLNVPNFGNYKIGFEWNPAAARFEPVASSIVPNGSTCTKAVLTGNAAYSSSNIAGYKFFSRVDSNGEFGGIQATSAASELMMSWAKTARQDQNPYLVGRSLTTFDASKSYGVIGALNGFPYPGGFYDGDLVEITGSPAQGAIAVLKTGSPAAFTLTLAKTSDIAGASPLTITNNCAPITGATVAGNLTYSSSNIYTFTSFSTTAGALTTASTSGSEFNANWGNFAAPTTFAKPSVGYGIMGKVNGFAYPNFTSSAVVFVADIGDAVSITSVNGSGKTDGTAVFFK
jgi:hypothetical protein